MTDISPQNTAISSTWSWVGLFAVGAGSLYYVRRGYEAKRVEQEREYYEKEAAEREAIIRRSRERWEKKQKMQVADQRAEEQKQKSALACIMYPNDGTEALAMPVGSSYGSTAQEQQRQRGQSLTKTQPPKQKSLWKRFRLAASDYFVNDGPKIVFIILWVLATIASNPSQIIIWRDLRRVIRIMSVGGPLARGSAACIKLNSALLLLTMLRNIISLLRATFLNRFLPLDKSIVFHRYLGWATAFWTAVHVSSHFHNFYNISTYTGDPKDLISIGMPVPAPDTWTLSFTTIAGSTGHVVLLCMILMYTTAVKVVRGPMFNLFWYIHHLFIVFIIVTCFHGFAANLEQPSFWMWVVGPAALYVVERLIRFIRGQQETILQIAVGHPSKVIELQLRKSTFNYKPGQYLFLNCPYIAGQEWHPFTITSAPEESHVSVHVRVAGDWTGDLWNFLNPEKKLGVVQENLLTAPNGGPIFRIDGPFGAASEEVFKFKTVMLVAGGIGITPFVSILKSIRYRLESGKGKKIERVSLYWISRDRNAFEWCNDVLAALEEENINQFLSINIFLTEQMNKDEIKNVMFSNSATDQFTGLRALTLFGRPNWKAIFEEKSREHNGSEVGVFFCGPNVLSKQLYKFCRRYTDSTTRTRFKFHKENF
ncbi:superoxide-generating NADPH oxidase flavocytochrome [Planoprotostelium fungivorum]|uniref:Superoxide-generating NADPH oxidase flavocytochrome n=1 Tax=Planoprotostelium fungivorum TaxID=1890364 RepID=A0A2P6MX16_9EUKA|nr:superoxide-generating NADPH oxidase flavocytochrome [Planoprotostelium fungivorum]